MTNLKHILEGALYAAAATFTAQLSDSLEGLQLPEPWPVVLVAVVALLAWGRAKLQHMADQETADG